MAIAVIGSGLSGLACVKALVRRGIKPIVIDAGVTLEPKVQTIVDRLRAAGPQAWSKTDLEMIRRNDSVKKAGVPRKLVFGSDFIYARDVPEAALSGDNVRASITLAKGGFGNAWGAAILPADRADLAGDWPAPALELEPHYRAVMRWLPLSGRADALAGHFGLFAHPPGALALAPQGEILHRDLENAISDNLCFGLARLAVYTQGARACRSCGLCLSGCVFGSIFSPMEDFDKLRQDNALEYRPGWIVLKITEYKGRPLVRMRRLDTGAVEEQGFDHVFLAAGAISTTRIMLRSMEAFDTPIALHDSQKFLLPLFRLSGAPYTVDRMNSLASTFVELRLPQLGNNWMHIQVSAVNDFLLRRLRIEERPWLQAALAPLLKRSLIAWCSLHSRHSADVVLTLRSGPTPKLYVDYDHLARARRSVRTALRALGRASPRFRSFIIPWLTSLSTPGAGNHLGGSFPMTQTSTERFATDVLGRPHGFRRLHIVDASVMPSIPATTIALLMMATADRIATQAPLD